MAHDGGDGSGPVVVWGRCPWPAELCGADASAFWPGEYGILTHDSVTVMLTCSNGHRWVVTRLSDESGFSVSDFSSGRSEDDGDDEG